MFRNDIVMCTSKWYRNNILTAHAIVGNIVLSAPRKYSEAIMKVSRKYSGIIRKVFEKYSQKYWKTIRKFFENYLKNWSANMCLNTCSKYSENIQTISRKYLIDNHMTCIYQVTFFEYSGKYLETMQKSDRQSADSRLSGDIFPSTQKLSGKYLKNNWKVFEKYAKK